MNRFKVSLRFIVTMLCYLLLVSCAQTARQMLPVHLQQAERHNIKGIAAESREDFIAAESEFMEAYRLFSAVENYRGMVTSLLNESRLYRRQGDKATTEKVLKQAVEMLQQTQELEAEICFEMTKLSLAKGDNDAAVNWAGRGVKSAADIDRGRMLNLHAVTYMQKSELLKAEAIARAALKASKAVADRREEANAFRTLGDIAYAGKNFKESSERFEAALSVDKDLALSIRISDDLRGLAKSFTALGDLDSAIVHYQRSASINMAERNYKRCAEDLEIMKVLFEHTNNMERLTETDELLEKMRYPRSNLEQR